MATGARVPGTPPLYSDRRKLNRSCFWNSERLLNLEITAFASEPVLECAWIASFRSSVRPSCRKKIRWPRPQSGAVRNSLPVAAPCETLSASPTPMSWISRSEYRFAVWNRSASTVALPVLIEGVWQSAQPTLENRLLPRPIEAEPPGESGSGFGGARKRWKFAKFVTPLFDARMAASRVAALTAASVFCTSFGTVANWLQEGV